MPTIGVEVGVAGGRLSSMLLKARPKLTLLLIDLWAPNASPAYLATGDGHARIPASAWNRILYQAHQNTAAFGNRVRLWRLDSVEAAGRLADRYLDFAFLDDDHSKEGCLRSITAWFPKVKASGWIGGHDYGHTNPRFKFGVTDAVHQYFDPLQIKIETDKNSTWFAFIDPQLVHYKGA
jgi:hypothetical protein